MKRKHILNSTLFVALLFSSNALFACGGEDSGKHIGTVSKVGASSFTIRDLETNKPITFSASKNILDELKHSKRQVLVNYEKNAAGELNASHVSN